MEENQDDPILEQLKENNEINNDGGEGTGTGSSARSAAKKATKEAAKKAAKAAVRVIAAGIRKVLIALLTNPYVLIPLIIIIISASAYFIIKDKFSNDSVQSSVKSIQQLVDSKHASGQPVDEQTKSLLEKFDVNRSFLTATIKDVNAIYENYIKELEDSDYTKSLENMKTMFGTDEVTLPELGFQSEPSQYSNPTGNTSDSQQTSTPTAPKVNVSGFLEVAKEKWQYIWKNNYSYDMSTQPPYTNGTMDCSAYVSWVLSAAGYDVGRLNTEGLKNQDWSKFGFEVIKVSENENVVSKLQPGDILVRSDGGGGYGHTNITVTVENGTVWSYDCGDDSNWRNSNGEPINATRFASGSGGGSNTRAGVIIRVVNSTSTSASSSSSNKISTSSKVNSSATTDKYPTDSTYVLPSQKRELYKHMLMTEKYNFNMINWKLYKAQGTGASRVLPSAPSDDIEYTVEPALGLRVPKSDEKTVDYFVQLVEPYLQSNLFPISMYNLTIASDTNAKKNEESSKNANFAYAIINEAYSDITMNIYEIEHYTENWSHEEWDLSQGSLQGSVQCLRLPNNLDSICRENKENITVTNDEVLEAYFKDQGKNIEEVTEIDKSWALGFLNLNGGMSTYTAKAKENKCSQYSYNEFAKSTNNILKISENYAYYMKAKQLCTALNVDISQVNYTYSNCSVAGDYEPNEETASIIKSNEKTEDKLDSTISEKDVEYKPYRVKAFDVVLEYEYNFQVYNTSNNPDSVSTSTTNLPNEITKEDVISENPTYVEQAKQMDCPNEGDSCDGKFTTNVGTYEEKINRRRINTTKNWNDKLTASPNNFSHRKYNIDDVVEFIAKKQNKQVSEVKLSDRAKKYYDNLDSEEKLNRIDFINAVPEIYNSYISDSSTFDKNIAIKQSDLEYSYSVLIRRFKEIQKDQILPYIYGQTLGLNLKYAFNGNANANCSDAANNAALNGGYAWPLPSNHYVSALFGYTELYSSTHEGIDIWASKDSAAQKSGVEVIAAKDGTVYIAKDDGIPSNTSLGGGYGNHIIIKHSDGKYTLYGHLETGTFKVSAGDVVKAGQVIANVGSSGNSSGWHLHFNISNEPYSSCEDPLLYYNVEPTSSKYPEYSKLQKATVTDFNAYKFVSVKGAGGGPSSLDGFLFIGDQKLNSIESDITKLASGITAIGVTNSNQTQWIDVIKKSSGTIVSEQVTLPQDPLGISINLGFNEIQNQTKMDELLDAVVQKYPGKKIYVNSVCPVGTEYKTINASVMNGYIKSFNQHLEEKCNSNSDLIYIDISRGLIDASGYLKAEYTTNGTELKSGDAQKLLVNNIKSGIMANGDTSSLGSEVTNVYSVAADMKTVDGVGTQTNTDAFKDFKSKYWSYITKWADAYELDPYLILAILSHESGNGMVNGQVIDENYHDYRTSEGGSDVYGILQKTVWNSNGEDNNIKDKYGNSIGHIIYDDGDSGRVGPDELLGNIDLQIRLCCAIVKDGFTKQDNITLSAIKAYNCGPNIKYSESDSRNFAYVQRVAAKYDIESSGSYSASLSNCIDNYSSLKDEESIEISGSFVGEGTISGNDGNNTGYFTNAGGTKYHTYNQSAYGPFWTNNGCGPTCCSIVLSGLKGEKQNEFTPPTIFTLTGYTNFENDLIPLLSKYNIKTDHYFYNKTRNGNYNGNLITSDDKKFIIDQLSKGYPVIAYMKPGGTYNGCNYTGHFITLLGVKENADVYVADPGGKNRDSWINIDKLIKEGLITNYLICKK